MSIGIIPKWIKRKLVKGMANNGSLPMLYSAISSTHKYDRLSDVSIENGKYGFEDCIELFDSNPSTKKIIGMTIGTAAYLYRLIRDAKPKIVLEIGRFKGGSTLLFAYACKNHCPDSVIISIDDNSKEMQRDGKMEYWSDVYNINKIHRLNIHMLNGKSTEVRTPVELSDDQIDFLFIDGSHNYQDVKDDYERWSKYCAPYCDILFDDAYNAYDNTKITNGVGAFVEELIREKKVELVKQVESLAHVRRLV